MTKSRLCMSKACFDRNTMMHVAWLVLCCEHVQEGAATCLKRPPSSNKRPLLFVKAPTLPCRRDLFLGCFCCEDWCASGMIPRFAVPKVFQDGRQMSLWPMGERKQFDCAAYRRG